MGERKIAMNRRNSVEIIILVLFALVGSLNSCTCETESSTSSTTLCDSDFDVSESVISNISNFNVVDGESSSLLDNRLAYYNRYFYDRDVPFSTSPYTDKYERIIVSLNNGYYLEFDWSCDFSDLDEIEIGEYDLFDAWSALYSSTSTVTFDDMDDCSYMLSGMVGSLSTYCDFFTQETTESATSVVRVTRSAENSFSFSSVIATLEEVGAIVHITFDTIYEEANITADFPDLTQECDIEIVDYLDECDGCSSGYTSTEQTYEDVYCSRRCEKCTVVDESGNVVVDGETAVNITTNDRNLCRDASGTHDINMNLL